MPLATVTLSGRFLHPDSGTPLAGKIVFTPSATTLTSAGDDVLVTGPVTVTLDAAGAFTVSLLATDAAGVVPSGWTWEVDEQLAGARRRRYYLSLPAALGSAQLADLAPTAPAAGVGGAAGAPVGAAGGALTGSYPNPTLAAATVALFEPAGAASTAQSAAVSAAAADATAKVSAHEADTTAVHGIADTTALETTAGSTAKVTAHAAASDPHGDRAYADARFLRTTTWRRRDLPDLATADSLYSGTTPVVSTTQNTTPTIPSAVTYAPATGPLLYSGAGDFQFGTVFPDTNYYLPTSRYPHTYSSGQTNWSLEFGTDADQFEVGFKHISSATMFRLSIDGRKVTDLMQSAGGVTPGSGYMLKINLGSAAPRLIRLDLTTFPFRGVYLPPTATMWRPDTRGGRLAVLGDSLTDGSSMNTGGGQGTWLQRAGRLLGCTDVWDQCRGGTGYTVAGSFATFGERVAGDVVAYSPDRVLVWGGYNDSSGSQSAIATAAGAVYAALKAGLPTAGITVIGCWSPTGSPGATLTDTDTTLRTAAAAAGLPFISPIGGSVYGADGSLVATHGAWITAQNASSYIGADSTHPTDSGHVYLARRIRGALAALMPA